MLIDSHAHLEDVRFAADREDVLERAWSAGVRRILTIGNGTGPDDMGCGLELAASYDWIDTTVGVHPHDAARMEAHHWDRMEELAQSGRVLAIGETGLDFYYDNSPRGVQQAVFRKELELAVRLNLPVVIHSRDADTETVEILQSVQPSRGIIHCFTGGEALADCALELGLLISFSGIVTFKSAAAIRDIARRIPEDRILVETDAPYLAPEPHRGSRNEPAFVVDTATRLAEIRGTTLETIARQTSRNFQELFATS